MQITLGLISYVPRLNEDLPSLSFSSGAQTAWINCAQSEPYVTRADTEKESIPALAFFIHPIS